jgi:hypothetical protein
MPPERRAPGSFVADNHFYPRVPNAPLHPVVRTFLRLGNERIAKRYAHLHPEVSFEAVRDLLSSTTKHFVWAGTDLFHVTDERGVRQNVVIETNSSPSGQKSMPLLDPHDDLGGYRRLLEHSFLPRLERRGAPKGALAVLWDKNELETTGYASALAELTGEEVLLVHLPSDQPPLPMVDGLLQVRDEQGRAVSLRGAVRYVTQKPWTRLPPTSRTVQLNPVIACLAGGRNKLVAAKAYDLFNAEMAETGLRIRTPETIWDVSLNEVPLWVARMGGVAVVKNPYSNAGQGVWTITSAAELEAFMALEHPYDQFVVQGLVGNLGWTSRTRGHRLYHVGTVPDGRGRIFVADLRFMVGTGPGGSRPVALYARRARQPLEPELGDTPSWSMLGTNLSVKRADGSFTTEPERLMLMDDRHFSQLGLGIDDLTEGYLQTVMSLHAIDRMAARLLTSKGKLRRRLFASMVPDARLLAEVHLP